MSDSKHRLASTPSHPEQDALGAVLQAHYEDAAARAEQKLSNSWATISERIQVNHEPSASAQSIPVSAPASGSNKDFWERGLPANPSREKSGGQIWRYVSVGLGSALAASLLTLGLTPSLRKTQAPTNSVVVAQQPVGSTIPNAAVGSNTAVLVPAVHRAPSVDELSVTSGSGTVITVEDPEGSATIIWIDSELDSQLAPGEGGKL